MVILKLIHTQKSDFGRVVFIRYRTIPCAHGLVVLHNNSMNRMASMTMHHSKFQAFQHPMVVYWPTVAMTGNGELGFDSGEGA